MLFLAVTAEEQGLLGSGYYAATRSTRSAQTLGVVNMDILNVHGRTQRHRRSPACGSSDLDDYAREVAAEQGRVVPAGPGAREGLLLPVGPLPLRQAGRAGSLELGRHRATSGKAPEWGAAVRAEYDRDDYHQPSDVVRPDWDMSGAVARTLQYYWMLGYEVAQASEYPRWKPGTEFKAVREAKLKAAGSGGQK